MDSVSNDTRDELEKIEIYHVKSISSFDVSNHEHLRKAFKWIKTQILIEEVHLQKGTKHDVLDYRLQFTKKHLSYHQTN